MAPLNENRIEDSDNFDKIDSSEDALINSEGNNCTECDVIDFKHKELNFQCEDKKIVFSSSNENSSNTEEPKLVENKKINTKDGSESDLKNDLLKEGKATCLSCLKENEKAPSTIATTVYHRKKADAIAKNGSIRAALFESSPQWFKSFLSEPEYIMLEEKKKHSEEIHRQADSLFSTSSGFTNYRGLLNLCIILLVLSNARLFLENIIKYGILIDPLQWVKLFLTQPYSAANIALIIGSNVFILIIYYTEKAMAKRWFSEKTALFIQAVTLILQLTIPAVVVLLLHPNPLVTTSILGMYTVQFMKLVSYASVNKWCRQSMSPGRTARMKRSKSVSVSEGSMHADGKEDTMIINYPDNLNYSDLYYFMFAPTLCYELNFPRSLRIRKRFLLKRIIEMLFILQLILGCIQQWILPLVHNSMKPLADMDAARVIERLLKLAIPNHFIWLMFFYWFFHSTLNVIAELLKFGDREFYKDWWNSDTVNQFWTFWNIPVHRWASRHLYKPLVKRGYNRFNASIAVFFLSAFFHEYLLSVPLQMFRLWAFMGMLGQVPLAVVQTKYIHGKYGNMVVWLSLILGQPIAILAYFHDYYVQQFADTLPTNQTSTA